jgi:DNA-binding XRE family transcriptional regulator
MSRIVANGPEIRRVRTLAGYSQRDLARAVGINESSMCQIEAGGGMLPGNLKRAAKALRVKIADLVVEVLTPAEVCRALGITRDVYNIYVADGALPTLGGGVTEADLEEFIAQHLARGGERVNATTARGAKRVLADAKRNRDYALAADLPTWLRAACEARVNAAEKRLRELEAAS